MAFCKLEFIAHLRIGATLAVALRRGRNLFISLGEMRKMYHFSLGDRKGRPYAVKRKVAIN